MSKNHGGSGRRIDQRKRRSTLEHSLDHEEDSEGLLTERKQQAPAESERIGCWRQLATEFRRRSETTAIERNEGERDELKRMARRVHAK